MTDVATPRPVEHSDARSGPLLADATRHYVLDIVIPVYNEEQRPYPRSIRRLHHFLATEVPYDGANHRGRQRQHRRHLGGSTPARARTARRRTSSTSTPQGPWRCTARGVVGVAGDGRRLHGRRPVNRPDRALMPLVAPLISGHSDVAIGSRLDGIVAGGSRTKT